MAVAQKIRVQRENKRRREREFAKMAMRAARFKLPGDTSVNALERYIAALDVLRSELSKKYGDLGSGPRSPHARLENERQNALSLLAQLKIEKVKPGNM